ncbi:ketopantoate reductase family protein [Candidatus Solincola sp.]|nr:2-dehydropantoate 2-reductase N-terminal domain-containing protein [Actinomycetota bacterium]
MRVAVVGAGAMGGLAAHILAASGAEVVLYETREERLASLATEGLRLRGVLEGESRPEVRHPSEGGAPFDVFILAVKAHVTAEALRPLSPFVHRDTFYLSLQEGNAWEELVELVGGERACAALAWVSAAEAVDGTVEVEGCRSLVVGSAAPGEGGAEPPGLAVLMGALQDGFPGNVEVTRDLRKATFCRLRSVAPVSALCALGGVAPRDLRNREGIGTWLEEAVEESTGVATSLGLKLPFVENPWEDAVWDRLPPPMLRDVRAGRTTERDYLTGFLLREAARCGARTPLLSALHFLLAEVERGERVPGEPLFRELRRRVSEERGMSLM